MQYFKDRLTNSKDIATIDKSSLDADGLFTHISDGLIDAAGYYEKECKTIAHLLQMEESKTSYFEMSHIPVSSEDIELMEKLSDKTDGLFNIGGETVYIKKGYTAEEHRAYLMIDIIKFHRIHLQSDGTIDLPHSGVFLQKRFFYYGEGRLFCQSTAPPKEGEGFSKSKTWPATMKDLFDGDCYLQNCVSFLIMEYFARASYLWADLAKDFLNNSAYSSIPVSEIWQAHSRSELLKLHYGVCMKRNNKESIGQGIFLIQARRVVKENELQKLNGFNPGRVYIGRQKKDLVNPLAVFILENCPDNNRRVKLPHGNYCKIDYDFVCDAIRTEIYLRRKISVTYRSARSIFEWHDEASRIYRARCLSTVQIPKNSKFKKLKLPPNCVRLTTRRQFLEEGDFQNNCVATYIDSVNDDACSIWSMRKEDGTRNTIEICVRRSKNNKDGYFYIAQMRSWGNGDVSDEDYELVREALSHQKPYKAKRK